MEGTDIHDYNTDDSGHYTHDEALLSISIKNIFGYHDYDNHNESYSPEMHGAHELYTEHNQITVQQHIETGDGAYHHIESSSVTSAESEIHLYVDGHHDSSIHVSIESFTVVMNHSDPLLHINEYIMPDLMM